MERDLPGVLLVDILKRLPVKSLLRFRCISKLWNSVISRSDFVKSHRDHNNSHENYNLLLLCGNGRKYALYQYNETLDEIPGMEFPVPVSECLFKVVGSINGLVCMSHASKSEAGGHRSHTVLWNPSIQKFFIIPEPEASCNISKSFVLFGLGHNELDDDYKLVRFINHSPIIHVGEPGASLVKIFSLSKGSWKSINAVALPYSLASSHANVNGNVHWRARYDPVIVAFDYSAEIFKVIIWPRDIKASGWGCDMITVWHGLLALAVVQDYGSSKVDFWVMKEYVVVDSWTKLFSFDLARELYDIAGIGQRGELLCVGGDFKLLSYCPEISSGRNLGLHIDQHGCQLHLLLKEGVGLLELQRDLKLQHVRSQNKKGSRSS